MFKQLFYIEFKSVFLSKLAFINALMFFVLMSVFFVFSIGAQPNKLKELATNILLVNAVLAVLLSLDNLFKEDFANGMLENYYFSQFYLPLLMFVKILINWIFLSFSLCLAILILAFAFNLSFEDSQMLIIVLFISSISLMFLGAAIASITISMNNASILIALLLLPLYIPILILANLVMNSFFVGVFPIGAILYLCAFAILTMFITPFFIALGIKTSLDND